MKILVADDDRIFAELTCAQLRNAGFQPIVAFDGMQALMMAKKTELSAIILDLNMPGGNGFEALRRLKSSNTTIQVPVIIVSATLDAATKAIAAGMGAAGALRKPIDFPRLFEMLSDVALRVKDDSLTAKLPIASKALVRTVMVVDDDRISVKVVSSWLNQLGYATLTAYSVHEALKVMGTRAIHAVIVDLDMPAVRGTALIQQLKAFNRTSSIRIIVLSGSVDEDEAKYVLSIGADDFLEKPASLEAIKRSLANQFTRSTVAGPELKPELGLEPRVPGPQLVIPAVA